MNLDQRARDLLNSNDVVSFNRLRSKNQNWIPRLSGSFRCLSWHDINLEGAILDGSFYGTSITGNLNGMSARNCNFSGTRLNCDACRAVFDGSSFEGATIFLYARNASFEGCLFKGTTLSGISNFSGSSFKGAKFQDGYGYADLDFIQALRSQHAHISDTEEEREHFERCQDKLNWIQKEKRRHLVETIEERKKEYYDKPLEHEKYGITKERLEEHAIACRTGREIREVWIREACNRNKR